MRFDEGFRRPEGVPRLAQAIREQAGSRTLRFMEICGTHTMAIAKAGLRPLLAPQVRLLSGPGCPVCVTPAGVIDAVLELAARPGVTLVSYGDLLRVPRLRPRGHAAAPPRAGSRRARGVFPA